MKPQGIALLVCSSGLSSHPFSFLGERVEEGEGLKRQTNSLYCAEPDLAVSVPYSSPASVSPRRAFRIWVRLGSLSGSPRPVRSFV